MACRMLHGLGRGAFCRGLSELRLHRGRTREVVTESPDAGRLGWVDGIDNVISRRDAIIRRGAIGYRGQQAAKVNIFQRIKGREQAVAGVIVSPQAAPWLTIQALLSSGTRAGTASSSGENAGLWRIHCGS